MGEVTDILAITLQLKSNRLHNQCLTYNSIEKCFWLNNIALSLTLNVAIIYC